jgi:hypothetical protein
MGLDTYASSVDATTAITNLKDTNFGLVKVSVARMGQDAINDAKSNVGLIVGLVVGLVLGLGAIGTSSFI